MIRIIYISLILIFTLSNCRFSQKVPINDGYIVSFSSEDYEINQFIDLDSSASNLFIMISSDKSCFNCVFVELYNLNCLDSVSIEKELLLKTNIFYEAGNNIFIPVIHYDFTNLTRRNYSEGVFHSLCGQGLLSFRYNSLRMERLDSDLN